MCTFQYSDLKYWSTDPGYSEPFIKKHNVTVSFFKARLLYVSLDWLFDYT